MKTTFFACAQGAVVDQRTNAISLFNLIEELQSPVFPFVIPNISLAMTFQREADEPDQPEMWFS
jgi:hypothetical protein